MSLRALAVASSLVLVALAAPAGPGAAAQPLRGAAAASAGPSASAAPPAALSDDAELARMSSRYEAGAYADCVTGLAALLDPAGPRPLTDPRIAEQARLLQAACHLGQGETVPAEAVLRAALMANPRIQPPDGLVYPQAVVDTFLRVRDALRDELRRADAARLAAAQRAAAEHAARIADQRRKVRELQELAARQERVVQNQRWVAAVPFGVGQFQNRQDELGWLFLGSETLLGVAALGGLLVHVSTYAQALDGTRRDPTETNRQLQTSYDVFLYSSWAFLGVGALGVAHAQLTFVPEFRETVRRPLPPSLQDIDVAPDGPPPAGTPPVGLGLRLHGRF